MCGIVLAGGNMFSGDVELFEKLIFHDVERGKDSTGVMTFRGGITEVCKLALPSDLFLHTKAWDEFKRKQVPVSQYSTATTTQFGSVYVGHNRAATLGKVCDENAHPFQSGHITLVHNGTLRNQSLLPDHKDFEVDSANIAHSIAKIGIDETVKKLHGAFTLVWINSEDATLHILRNSERPFHLLEANSGDWFGASEEEMLMWVMLRQKSWSKARVKRHFETKVGVEYVFNIEGKKMQLREEREHVLPSFQYVSSGSTYRSSSWNDYDYDTEWRNTRRAYQAAGQAVKTPTTTNGSTGSEASQAKQDFSRDGLNKLLEDRGYSFRIDNRVGFWPTEYTPYSLSRKDYGCVRGFGYNNVGGKSLRYDVVVHNVTASSWEQVDKHRSKGQHVMCYATLRTVGIVHGSVTMSLHSLTHALGQPTESEKISKEQKAEAAISGTFQELYDGTQISFQGWVELVGKQHYKCPVCSGALPWAETGECLINEDGQVVHFDCHRYDGTPTVTVNRAPTVMDSYGKLCVQFQSGRLKDGSSITHDEFKTQMSIQGGVCPMCDDPIDWDEIEECVFHTDGRTIMHEGCKDLVNYDPELQAHLDAVSAKGNALDQALVEDDDLDKVIDQFLCDICRDVCDMNEWDKESSEALHTDICQTCAKAHKLNAGDDAKYIDVYRAGSDSKSKELINRDQFNKFFIKGMGSETVTFETVDEPGVRVTRLGTKQWRYYRMPQATSSEPREVLSLSKTLKNGMRINKAMWTQWNVCSKCHSVIPWKDAEKACFDAKKRIFCERCAKKEGIE